MLTCTVVEVTDPGTWADAIVEAAIVDTKGSDFCIILETKRPQFAAVTEPEVGGDGNRCKVDGDKLAISTCW